MNSSSKCCILIVTHNAQKFMARCFTGIDAQIVQPQSIVIVDSGSADSSYLDAYQSRGGVRIHRAGENIGYCKASNLGYELIPAGSEYVLLINPDTFLKADTIQEGIAFLERRGNQAIAAVTGPMFGYSMETDSPTGRFDSSGIFRKWYGRWYDRDQGVLCHDIHRTKVELLPAICSALMLCRKTSLDQVLLRGRELFDESLIAQKDDIELCLRLRKHGWKLAYGPLMQAYHCRGWSQARPRHTVSRANRLLASRNDCLLDLRYRSPYIAMSSCKYLLVRLLNI